MGNGDMVLSGMRNKHVYLANKRELSSQRPGKNLISFNGHVTSMTISIGNYDCLIKSAFQRVDLSSKF